MAKLRFRLLAFALCRVYHIGFYRTLAHPPSLSCLLFQQLKQAINESISFIIVRHPFERLVSAYKDKIQYALPNSHHHKLGNRIIQKYRKTVNGKVSARTCKRKRNDPL